MTTNEEALASQFEERVPRQRHTKVKLRSYVYVKGESKHTKACRRHTLFYEFMEIAIPAGSREEMHKQRQQHTRQLKSNAALVMA